MKAKLVTNTKGNNYQFKNNKINKLDAKKNRKIYPKNQRISFQNPVPEILKKPHKNLSPLKTFTKTKADIKISNISTLLKEEAEDVGSFSIEEPSTNIQIENNPAKQICNANVNNERVSKYYDNSISCYSFSKSLSLPGERIGYVAINPRATDADIFAVICGQISRGIGHNCPASTSQLAVARVIDEVSDLSVYEKNMNLLYDALTRIGFEVVRPGGTFYIFPKALEEDANAFCMKAKKYDLILVPADNFGCPGYFRMAYCIDTEKVERSIPVLEKFAREEYGLDF